MVHGKNRIPYRIDRRLTGLAGLDYDATISFGLPFESEDSRYGKYRLLDLLVYLSWDRVCVLPTAKRRFVQPNRLGQVLLPQAFFQPSLLDTLSKGDGLSIMGCTEYACGAKTA